MTVCIVDTSVLCEVLAVPRKHEEADLFVREFVRAESSDGSVDLAKWVAPGFERATFARRERNRLSSAEIGRGAARG